MSFIFVLSEYLRESLHSISTVCQNKSLVSCAPNLIYFGFVSSFIG